MRARWRRGENRRVPRSRCGAALGARENPRRPFPSRDLNVVSPRTDQSIGWSPNGDLLFSGSCRAQCGDPMRRTAPPLSRSIWLLCGAALIIGAVSVAARTLPSAASEDPKTCTQASGDVAIAACTRAIAAGAYQGHELAKLHYDRAFEYHAKGDDDRAIADYNESIRLDPNYADSYNNRGTAWLAKGNYDRAIADFSAAIRLDPKDPAGFSNRGATWKLKGAPDRAIADLNEAIRLDPKDPCAFYNRAMAWSDKGERDRAIADYGAAIRLKPKVAAFYLNRGNAWGDKGDNDRAIADYSEAIRLDPKGAMALYLRGVARQKKGDKAGGTADIAAAKSIDPNAGNWRRQAAPSGTVGIEDQ